MKIGSSKFILIFVIIVFMHGLGSSIYSEEKIKGSYNNDVLIYESIEIDNKKPLKIEGVDLAKYKDIEFYKYIKIDNAELILLGKEKPDMVNVLIAIDLEEKGREEILKKYSWEIAARAKNMDIALIRIINEKEITPILLVVYREDASGNIVETTYFNINIFKTNINKKHISVNDEQIEETNIVYSQDYDNPNAYHAHADIVDLENQNKKFPAFKKVNKIMLCDMNHDGYEDILIWSKINLSRLMKDEGKDDFLFDSEKLYVMYFDPETKAFKNRVPFDWD